ncbi:MAG: MmgE/PrpD family protein [Truepera sp.]|nr:MmgE/PrpD family protein [Truepera sp.]
MSDRSPLVQRLVDHALQLRYEDISEGAVRIAKWLVFDSIGTGLGGYQTLRGRKAVDYAAAMMPGDQATVLGGGHRSTVEGAAFANGTMIKVLGMDDSHRSAGHIAAEVVPAVLATAEAYQTSGRMVIEAIVAAYDLAVRLGKAVRTEQRRRGLDLKGTLGPIAAALAAGRCAGLERQILTHAVSMAADMASGTEQYVYESGDCDTKDLISGFAARNGVFAVQLAQSGFFGPSGALDGEYGFLRAFGDGAGTEVFDDLGEGFAITSTAFKPHGGCRHTHQSVDAVQQLLATGPLEPSEIERVVVRTYRSALEPFFRVDPDPGSREVASLSIRVATAVALSRGSTWPSDLAHWDDPEVRRLRRLVELEVDPEIESRYPDGNGARVEVQLKDGRRLEGSVPYAKGEPEFRMTEDELRVKFEALTSELLPPGCADELFTRCLNLESEPGVGPILEQTAPRLAVGAAD